MNRDGLERLDALLVSALSRPPSERDAFVESSCAGDPEGAAHLRELLALVSGARGGVSASRTTEPEGLGSLVEPPFDGAPLEPGRQLGRYEIRSLLGAGGQGRVYCAYDPMLGREVALKAISAAFRGDAVSLRRFEREARVLAALSHPNIAAIHGFEVLEGAPYLVLERVDGESLAQRLARGPLPFREAVAIAAQVAEGLSEAHGKGIVHRDLKPSNVMLASGGRVKLVDFGLAKSMPAKRSSLASDLTTVVGTAVGTAPYMSPEQIRGEEVDARADVWAFGCLLYEMLVGRAAFTGRSVPEVVAAVLRDDPDFSALPRAAGPRFCALLSRCLRRDLTMRPKDIGDLRLELLDVATLPSGGVPAASAAPIEIEKAGIGWLRVGLLGLGTVGLLGLGVALVSRQTPSPWGVAGPLVLSLDLPPGMEVSSDFSPPFAVSPEGDSIVLVATRDGKNGLYVRSLGALDPRPLPGTEDARQPVFSPDGASVAFFADRKLLRVPASGGTAVPLCDIGTNPRGAAWPRAGVLVVAPSLTSGLVTVPDGGGAAVPLTTLDRTRGERAHRWPDGLPGGGTVIFTVGFAGATYDEGRIDAVSLETGERRTILENAGFARYLPSGHLLFVRAGRALAVRFDPQTLETKGSPEVVLPGLRYEPQNGAAHLAVSASGAVLYGPAAPMSSETHLAWLGRDGRVTRITATPRVFRDPRVSPDGQSIAVVIGTHTDADLWIVAASGTLTRITSGVSPHRPVWRPDGTGVTVGAFVDAQWRLLTYPVDGKGSPKLLLSGARRLYPSDWSRDGAQLVYQEDHETTAWDLRVLDAATGASSSFASSPANESTAALSHDGKLLAYESDELDGLVQVHVAAFPGGDQKVRASANGVRWPVFASDGTLFFWDTTVLRLASVLTRVEAGRLTVSGEAPVFAGAGAPDFATLMLSGTARYDVPPRADRFLVLERHVVSTTKPFARPVLLLGMRNPMRPR